MVTEIATPTPELARVSSASMPATPAEEVPDLLHRPRLSEDLEVDHQLIAMVKVASYRWPGSRIVRSAPPATSALAGAVIGS